MSGRSPLLLPQPSAQTGSGNGQCASVDSQFSKPTGVPAAGIDGTTVPVNEKCPSRVGEIPNSSNFKSLV